MKRAAAKGRMISHTSTSEPTSSTLRVVRADPVAAIAMVPPQHESLFNGWVDGFDGDCSQHYTVLRRMDAVDSAAATGYGLPPWSARHLRSARSPSSNDGSGSTPRPRSR